MLHLPTFSSTPLHVLVVDDDDVDREKILRLLKQTPLDCDIQECSSGHAALELIRQHPFQCAILDYQLSDTLGSELIEAIQHYNPQPVPIIMVSGYSDECLIANLMREGIFDYLPKRNLHAAQLQRAMECGLAWAEEEHHASEQRQRFIELTEGLPHLIWTCLPDGRCDFLNQRWCEYTGQSQEQQLGYGWLEQVHPEDRAPLLKAWADCVNSGTPLSIKFRIGRYDGEYRWFDTRATPLLDDKGNLIRWLGSNTDINDVETMRLALANSERRFHAAFDYAPLGMALVSLDGQILQSNAAFNQLVMATAQSGDHASWTMESFSHRKDELHEQEYLRALQQDERPVAHFEKRLFNHQGQAIDTQVSVALINTDHQQPCYLYQFQDISERKRYEEELLKLAHYDTLTGLGNRRKLLSEMEFLIQKSHRASAPFALLFGDLDHFKHINDNLGHEAGDLLLRRIARRLQKGLRRGDNVYRLGGDEFVVLLQDVNRFEAVITVAEKLIQLIKRPIRLNNHAVHAGMSFGIALYPTDGDTPQTLLRNADSALYEAKTKGRGSHQLYRKELTDYVHNRLMLDADIRKAIHNQEFELYYQPVVNLNNHHVEYLEALIRWHHPVRGLVSPGDFIPYAQENGLINRIGEWVINDVCRQAEDWHTKGITLPIAINISARQFNQHNLGQLIQHALAEHHLQGQQLILEITEQLFMENAQDNIRQIEELKAMGLRISLDDFGVGYSSLSYVMRFAPHYLKIDRALIEQIDQAKVPQDTSEYKQQQRMLQAIIDLQKIIPMTIIAEGLETEAQQHFLIECGCGMAQGYLYSHPLPARDVPGLLQQLDKQTIQ
ncbi:EAL domain-containing protein [Cellvibrio japonicus]|uniref:MorA n=1 Tax=Cellvibrio japonicus (strain Ueda107) TaxID=498211 RepID=B3PKH8_CELJU|nr:EAL domain-containing protein [Cellvibrio japonicus]ACE85393.1 MorA [Cellvibrio japonicus Ueda107]QEI12844.1 EAL domain-containing protein [Cellvibrio japonicus]QEI16418.1 EAL domain-containing protein [Cellvibrio japonicus]QEI19996.1 EAL domain-containing protein [Cellvibrio japonicus]